MISVISTVETVNPNVGLDVLELEDRRTLRRSVHKKK